MFSHHDREKDQIDRSTATDGASPATGGFDGGGTGGWGRAGDGGGGGSGDGPDGRTSDGPGDHATGPGGHGTVYDTTGGNGPIPVDGRGGDATVDDHDHAGTPEQDGVVTGTAAVRPGSMSGDEPGSGPVNNVDPTWPVDENSIGEDGTSDGGVFDTRAFGPDGKGRVSNTPEGYEDPGHRGDATIGEGIMDRESTMDRDESGTAEEGVSGDSTSGTPGYRHEASPVGDTAEDRMAAGHDMDENADGATAVAPHDAGDEATGRGEDVDGEEPSDDANGPYAVDADAHGDDVNDEANREYADDGADNGATAIGDGMGRDEDDETAGTGAAHHHHIVAGEGRPVDDVPDGEYGDAADADSMTRTDADQDMAAGVPGEGLTDPDGRAQTMVDGAPDGTPAEFAGDDLTRTGAGTATDADRDAAGEALEEQTCAEPEPLGATAQAGGTGVADASAGAMRPGDAEVPAAGAGPLGDVDTLRDRWQQAQLGFIDDPQESVRTARTIAGEALEAHVARLRERLDSLDSWQQSQSPDTEVLRAAMRGYRTVVESLSGTADQ
jgi:hypothetical protein